MAQIINSNNFDELAQSGKPVVLGHMVRPMQKTRACH